MSNHDFFFFFTLSMLELRSREQSKAYQHASETEVLKWDAVARHDIGHSLVKNPLV